MKTMGCHDCGNTVSLSARQCPRCGSKEPAGPYRPSRREARRNGIEARNVRTLILSALGLGAVGALYGVETGSSVLYQVMGALWCGFVGAVIGVPLAAAINLTRHWR